MSHRDKISVVVSGISGIFPNADNMEELSYNLYNKIDMIDNSETRWKHFNEIVPRRSGKIRNVDKFDANCFYFSQRQANSCDPQMRMLTEHCYEAILDAGVSPYSLNGTRTQVFVGCSAQDSKEAHVYTWRAHLVSCELSLVFMTSKLLTYEQKQPICTCKWNIFRSWIKRSIACS